MSKTKKIFCRWSTIALSALLVGCAPDDSADSAELPDETELPADTGEPWVPVDTGDTTTINETPADLLTIREWGTWSLSPASGPYTTLIGTLEVREYLNGLIPDTADTADDVVLDCEVTYAVNGVPSVETCAGCSFVFDVTFSVTSGDLEPCHDPALPDDGETWSMGFNPTNGSVDRDLGGGTLWFAWFDATLAADQLDVLWEATVGVSVPEDTEDQ